MKHTEASAAAEGVLRRHVWVALLLSLVVFGLGQLYTGSLWWLAGLIAAWVALLAVFQTDIPATFIGFAGVVAGLFATQLVSVVQAGMTAWRNPIIARQPVHRWYVYAAYVVAFLIAMPADESEFRSLFGGYHPYRVSSHPMEPGLAEGEYFWTETVRGATKVELAGWLGSIAVVSWPQEQAGFFAYRLIAVGGQTVAVTDRKVVIDGKEIPQRELCSVPEDGSGEFARRSVETVGGASYVVQNFDTYEFSRNSDEVTVPEDSSFVIGDNRENANDSRTRGPVANENLAARALFIFWSNDWRRIGKTLIPAAAVEASDYCPPAMK